MLVVDDDPDLRAYLIRCLSGDPSRVTVTEARNGTEALEALRGARVDMMITDVLMNDLDGLALCRRLDAPGAVQNPPVLLITGDQDSLTQARTYAEAQPRRAVLEKPFNATLLMNALGKLLERETR